MDWCSNTALVSDEIGWLAHYCILPLLRNTKFFTDFLQLYILKIKNATGYCYICFRKHFSTSTSNQLYEWNSSCNSVYWVTKKRYSSTRQFLCLKLFTNITFVFALFSLHSSVHLIPYIWWRPCDGRGVPHPSASENWYQSPWQRWWLPGQSSCSLEPRNRYGTCTETGRQTLRQGFTPTTNTQLVLV